MNDTELIEYCYEQLLEIAQESESIKTFLLYCISQDYLNKSSHILNEHGIKWFLKFEFVALVASQKNKLLSWIEKWEVLDDKLAEIYILVEKNSGILITEEFFPCHLEWYAKHIFSLPVHICLC